MAISVSHRLGRECDGSVSVLNSSGLVMAIELAGQACDFQVFSSLQNARDFLKNNKIILSVSYQFFQLYRVNTYLFGYITFTLVNVVHDVFEMLWRAFIRDDDNGA